LIAVCLLWWLFIVRENTFRPRNAERFPNEEAVASAVQKSRAMSDVPEKVEVLAQTAVQTDQSGQGWVLVKCYTATPQGDHAKELDHRVVILRFKVRKGEGADGSWQIDDQDELRVLDCFVLFRTRLANSDDSWKQNQGNDSPGSLQVKGLFSLPGAVDKSRTSGKIQLLCHSRWAVSQNRCMNNEMQTTAVKNTFDLQGTCRGAKLLGY
jgi:hypothetical protein